LPGTAHLAKLRAGNDLPAYGSALVSLYTYVRNAWTIEHGTVLKLALKALIGIYTLKMSYCSKISVCKMQ